MPKCLQFVYCQKDYVQLNITELFKAPKSRFVSTNCSSGGNVFMPDAVFCRRHVARSIGGCHHMACLTASRCGSERPKDQVMAVESTMVCKSFFGSQRDLVYDLQIFFG